MSYNYTVLNRFLRYVQIDTQSDPESTTVPTTMKQKDLAKVLVAELLEMGVEDAEMDQYGYVYATIPANTTKDVPVICYCSHMDTSPDSSGTGVKPIVHKNYQGQTLVLPDDTSIQINPEQHPDLKAQIGSDIVTASGTTLLGADNKAGVAEIMDFAHYMMTNPDVKHGKIRILFTPDEEVGHGADHVDIQRLGAHYGYTVDGETLGSIEDETFSADGVKVVIHGVSAHPGFAKGNMESAIRIAAKFVESLPINAMTPETTSGKEGFIHPVEMRGSVEQATISFIIRSFVDAELKTFESLLEEHLKAAMVGYSNSSYTFTVTEQYRNMKNILNSCPQVADYAEEAIKRAGIVVKRGSIRGGTDGSRLSFMGLPCPNIFAGEHAFHSKMEWVSVQDMQYAVDTLIHLAKIWEEKS